MDDPPIKSRQSRPPAPSHPSPSHKAALGWAGFIALAVLGAFLLAALAYAVAAWHALGSVALSGAGWLFLTLGVVISVALGAGLMALVFYSAHHDYDR